MIRFFIKLWKYINKADPRPRLPKGYYRPAEREATWQEAQLIAARVARTPEQAADLLARYGTVPGVLCAVRPPERKKPPRLRRLVTVIRRMFPGT